MGWNKMYLETYKVQILRVFLKQKEIIYWLSNFCQFIIESTSSQSIRSLALGKKIPILKGQARGTSWTVITFGQQQTTWKLKYIVSTHH